MLSPVEPAASLQPLIERFYAAESTLGDKARILSGKPPVPLGAALNCLIEKGRA